MKHFRSWTPTKLVDVTMHSGPPRLAKSIRKCLMKSSSYITRSFAQTKRASSNVGGRRFDWASRGFQPYVEFL
jgi:hypothetical protein